MKKVTIIMILIFLTGVVYAGYAYIQDDEAKPTPVEAIEVVRGEGYVDYIIHQQPADEGEIIFFLRNIKDDNVVVNAEYVQKTRRGVDMGVRWRFYELGSKDKSTARRCAIFHILNDVFTKHER
ncbi:hypothetical protein [Paenibacillus sp. JCM 10914]|uniref:hypothetical protein n=1 Tax=Paenibacillus sp. JCM 10914 TaxID=1236974 RepID=UPI0003CC9DDD|nr:hypothetical protein [Paenibacillus sp. JCM 10914]GAE05220.1 hypothetical protein JCM10914_1313 [Paenibacillus sp. JCM 10914]